MRIYRSYDKKNFGGKYYKFNLCFKTKKYQHFVIQKSVVFTTQLSLSLLMVCTQYTVQVELFLLCHCILYRLGRVSWSLYSVQNGPNQLVTVSCTDGQDQLVTILCTDWAANQLVTVCCTDGPCQLVTVHSTDGLGKLVNVSYTNGLCQLVTVHCTDGPGHLVTIFVEKGRVSWSRTLYRPGRTSW